MKQILVKTVAALQIVVGVLLLIGTVGLTTTAYRTVRSESEQLAENLSAAAESLRHAMRMLDNGNSTARWCGFVCILGFCVSMLFFANGLLLLVFAKCMSVK